MGIYNRGADKERRLMARMEFAGWVCYRSAGSHGCADLVALRLGHVPLLVQVKGTAAGPFAGFSREERFDLMREARSAGAKAVLAHWPPGGRIEWYAAPQWERIEALI